MARRKCRVLPPHDPAKSHAHELNDTVIYSVLEACQYVLEIQGESQSSFWLASQIMEMKLWRAIESEAGDALLQDIKKLGESSRFVQVGDDEFGLREWTAESK